MLPNFILVGAAKSGTSSLYHYLRQHPEVFMPREKAAQLGEPAVEEPLLSASDEQTPGEAGRPDDAKPAVSEEDRDVRAISLVESWKKGFEGAVTSSPAVCGDRVVFGCRDGSIYAFTQAGEMVWRYETGDGVGASPCCESGNHSPSAITSGTSSFSANRSPFLTVLWW